MHGWSQVKLDSWSSYPHAACGSLHLLTCNTPVHNSGHHWPASLGTTQVPASSGLPGPLGVCPSRAGKGFKCLRELLCAELLRLWLQPELLPCQPYYSLIDILGERDDRLLSHCLSSLCSIRTGLKRQVQERSSCGTLGSPWTSHTLLFYHLWNGLALSPSQRGLQIVYGQHLVQYLTCSRCSVKGSEHCYYCYPSFFCPLCSREKLNERNLPQLCFLLYCQLFWKLRPGLARSWLSTVS